MWRRTVKVFAISYAIKTALFVGLWLAAPDLVRQGRDRVVEAWRGVVDPASGRP